MLSSSFTSLSSTVDQHENLANSSHLTWQCSQLTQDVESTWPTHEENVSCKAKKQPG